MSSRKYLMLFAGALGLTLSPLAALHADTKTLRLATTTSTDNSGLLRYLLPDFEKETGYKVHVVAVGTGKALRMGQDGDADVLLVHAPPAEEKFMAADYGVNRRYVMYNDFVIVGPDKDPAGIQGMKSAAPALAKIDAAKATFVSRGDNSGTDQKEKSLWKQVKITPTGSWYKSMGQGMGKVLTTADELQGYTLTDRGTWLSMKTKLGGLRILVEGDPQLFNPYHIMAVNPARYRDVNYAGAMSLIAWMTSVEGQQRIGAFRVKGDELFTPTAIPVKTAEASAKVEAAR
jgi:tungstate transport system substrate-binding protein